MTSYARLDDIKMKESKQGFLKRSKKKQEELNREINEEGGVGGKDLFAMIFSAFIVFVPVCLIVILALSLLVMWLFGAI